MATPFTLETVSKADSFRPVWGCITLDKGGPGWTAHDRLDNLVDPEGGTFAYMDGHARWVPRGEMASYWNWYGYWYAPADGLD